jgi:hypothetical protein
MPKVTITIPCHNEEEFLEETVRSLMAQTERDIEVLICDNASTDRTADIARRLAREDQRVSLEPLSENIGGRLNFLRAFKMGSGSFFMWAGAHDLYAPGFVETLLKGLELDQDAVIAFCDSVFIQRDGQRNPEEPVFRLPDLSQPDPEERFQRAVWSFWRCDLLHGLMRRERVDVSPLERAKEMPDMAFLPGLMLAGTVYLERELLFFRRLNRGVQTKKENEEHLAEDGYLETTESGRDDRWITVRDSLLQSIEAARLPRASKKRLREITCFCFLKRFGVSWEVTEAATWRESMRLVFSGRDPKVKKRIYREIHERLLREHLPRDFGDATISRRLRQLLKEKPGRHGDLGMVHQ